MRKKSSLRHLKNTTIASVALFILMFILAVSLHLLKFEDVPGQFFAALLAAAITALITDLLLKNQTNSEFDKLKQERVYEEKLQIFQNYLHFVCNLSLRRSVSEKQQMELQYQVSLIAVHMAPENFKVVLESTDNILTARCQIDERNDREIRNWLIDIVQCFRYELYGEEAPRPLAIDDSSFVSLMVNSS